MHSSMPAWQPPWLLPSLTWHVTARNTGSVEAPFELSPARMHSGWLLFSCHAGCRASQALKALNSDPCPSDVQVDMVLSGHVHAYQRTCELVVWCVCLALCNLPSLGCLCVPHVCATPSAWLLQTYVCSLLVIHCWNRLLFMCQADVHSPVSSTSPGVSEQMVLSSCRPCVQVDVHPSSS